MATPLVAKRSQVYEKVTLTSHLIHYLNKHLPNKFLVSSAKNFLKQHDVHLVNYGSISFKIDDKAGYAQHFFDFIRVEWNILVA